MAIARYTCSYSKCVHNYMYEWIYVWLWLWWMIACMSAHVIALWIQLSSCYFPAQPIHSLMQLWHRKAKPSYVSFCSFSIPLHLPTLVYVCLAVCLSVRVCISLCLSHSMLIQSAASLSWCFSLSLWRCLSALSLPPPLLTDVFSLQQLKVNKTRDVANASLWARLLRRLALHKFLLTDGQSTRSAAQQ